MNRHVCIFQFNNHCNVMVNVCFRVWRFWYITETHVKYNVTVCASCHVTLCLIKCVSVSLLVSVFVSHYIYVYCLFVNVCVTFSRASVCVSQVPRHTDWQFPYHSAPVSMTQYVPVFESMYVSVSVS